MFQGHNAAKELFFSFDSKRKEDIMVELIINRCLNYKGAAVEKRFRDYEFIDSPRQLIIGTPNIGNELANPDSEILVSGHKKGEKITNTKVGLVQTSIHYKGDVKFENKEEDNAFYLTLLKGGMMSKEDTEIALNGDIAIKIDYSVKNKVKYTYKHTLQPTANPKYKKFFGSLVDISNLCSTDPSDADPNVLDYDDPDGLKHELKKIHAMTDNRESDETLAKEYQKLALRGSHEAMRKWSMYQILLASYPDKDKDKLAYQYLRKLDPNNEEVAYTMYEGFKQGRFSNDASTADSALVWYEQFAKSLYLRIKDEMPEDVSYEISRPVMGYEERPLDQCQHMFHKTAENLID